MDATEDDPTRPARILAHAIARTADRVPMLRKISRHAEGTDRKAGLASDLLAAAWDLGVRNQVQLEALATEYLEKAGARNAARRAAAAAEGNGGSPKPRRFGRTTQPQQEET
jgi:hypothetical protein